tara:strand:+ start:842 stop:997 length:156 start_codon:yes stop_codon:yes gene_type:complete
LAELRNDYFLIKKKDLGAESQGLPHSPLTQISEASVHKPRSFENISGVATE